MKLIGYIDGKRHFIRDEIMPHELGAIANYIKEALTETMRQRLVTFVEDGKITRMFRN